MGLDSIWASSSPPASLLLRPINLITRATSAPPPAFGNGGGAAFCSCVWEILPAVIGGGTFAPAGIRGVTDLQPLRATFPTAQFLDNSA